MNYILFEESTTYLSDLVSMLEEKLICLTEEIESKELEEFSFLKKEE